MRRSTTVGRQTSETQVNITLDLDGNGSADISTGIPFFDHMLSLFSAHGFFDLTLAATGDLEVGFHHTVEDVGIVLGQALSEALGDRHGLRRYGQASVPMDEALASVVIDLSNRSFLALNYPADIPSETGFGLTLVREFFRSLTAHAGMNLHVNVSAGQSEHHIIEAVFKAFGRALDMASSAEARRSGAPSTKGTI